VRKDSLRFWPHPQNYRSSLNNGADNAWFFIPYEPIRFAVRTTKPNEHRQDNFSFAMGRWEYVRNMADISKVVLITFVILVASCRRPPTQIDYSTRLEVDETVTLTIPLITGYQSIDEHGVPSEKWRPPFFENFATVKTDEPFRVRYDFEVAEGSPPSCAWLELTNSRTVGAGEQLSSDTRNAAEQSESKSSFRMLLNSPSEQGTYYLHCRDPWSEKLLWSASFRVSPE
jgi:hypothetical protein